VGFKKIGKWHDLKLIYNHLFSSVMLKRHNRELFLRSCPIVEFMHVYQLVRILNSRIGMPLGVYLSTKYRVRVTSDISDWRELITIVKTSETAVIWSCPTCTNIVYLGDIELQHIMSVLATYRSFQSLSISKKSGHHIYPTEIYQTINIDLSI
jgi:hypothetical protein